jgi:hypothetical protein
MLKVGILGGCINMPMWSVGMDDLYHRQLVRQMVQRNRPVRVRLKAYKSARTSFLLEQMDDLAKRRECEVIFYQIRPILLIHLTRVIWKDRRDGVRFPLTLNPFYRQSFLDYEERNDHSPTARFNDANFLLARATGLLERATVNLSAHLSALMDWSHRPGNPRVCFIGPIFGDVFSESAVKYWTRSLGELCDAQAWSLVNLSDISYVYRPELWEPDGFHIKPAGHALLATRMEALLMAREAGV